MGSSRGAVPQAEPVRARRPGPGPAPASSACPSGSRSTSRGRHPTPAGSTARRSRPGSGATSAPRSAGPTSASSPRRCSRRSRPTCRRCTPCSTPTRAPTSRRCSRSTAVPSRTASSGGPSASPRRMAARSATGSALGFAGPLDRPGRRRRPGRRSRTGDVVRAGSHVIVTLPPTLAGRLEYSPALPSWRDQLTQRLPAGSVIKLYAVYPEPFWRADGLTGQAASDEGPVKVTFDNSPPSGTPGRPRRLHGGQRRSPVGPPHASERRDAAVECFVRYFGPRAADPSSTSSATGWPRSSAGAATAPTSRPGVWTAYGEALTAPVGRIHWAGAECSPVWNGYMEGAVRSGERVACEPDRSALVDPPKTPFP